MVGVKKKAPKKRAKRNYAKQCDDLAGAIARARGYCMAASADCGGPLQWAHGFPRSYHAVRWDLRNGFTLCRDHHAYYTHRPLQWDDWMRAQWGDELYAEMRAIAVSYVKPDLPSLLLELKTQVAA